MQQLENIDTVNKGYNNSQKGYKFKQTLYIYYKIFKKIMTIYFFKFCYIFY